MLRAYSISRGRGTCLSRDARSGKTQGGQYSSLPVFPLRIPRFLLAFLLLSLPASAKFLPEALGEFERLSLAQYQPENFDIYSEFGFEAGEHGRYETADGRVLELRAARFQDGTGAFAAFQWLRPPEGRPVAYGEEASQREDVTVIRFGNFVVRMNGAVPVDEHVEAMLAFLPRVQMGPAPPFVRFVPADQLVANSQRYILGPASLEKLVPEIPPSVAAFHFGTEGQFMRYETPTGEHRMVLFSYPSSQIARGQIEPFRELPNVVSKRVGPLIAAVISPASADEAERLLARVRYAAEVTVTPQTSQDRDNLGTLFLDIVVLCLILAGLMIVGGVIVAGSRLLVRRLAPDSIFASPQGADMVRLDIERRR